MESDAELQLAKRGNEVARIARMSELALASLASWEASPNRPTDKIDCDLKLLAQACSDLRVRIAAWR